MRRFFRNAMTLTALTVGMTYACVAQSATTQLSLTASVDPPATSDAKTDATHASSGAAQPELQPTIAQEIEALKSRIDELEKEVAEEKARALADSADTAIKAAEKELVAGTGSAALNSATGVSRSLHAATRPVAPGESSSLQAAAPPAPAAPTTPKNQRRETYQGGAVPRRLDLAK